MAHEHAHDHDHGTLTYLGAEVSDATLDRFRELHPTLADNLALTRRYPDLTDEEREQAVQTQRKVEGHAQWTPGYHAPGDTCGACGKPTMPLFSDKFDGGALPYAAFVLNVPVHAEPDCLTAFAKAVPSPAPRDVDRLRRQHMKDLQRPAASTAMFFRHDVLAHPAFALEDWANSVAEANPDMERSMMKDIERLMGWAHKRLFH